MRIQKIYFDSPGSDTRSNSSLNAEWIRLENLGSSSAQLQGWYIKDRASHTFTLPRYTLRPGYTIHVHTGKGTNDGRHRFWQRGAYVWNIDGDKAYLRNASGTLVDTCEYSSAGSYKICES